MITELKEIINELIINNELTRDQILTVINTEPQYEDDHVLKLINKYVKIPKIFTVANVNYYIDYSGNNDEVEFIFFDIIDHLGELIGNGHILFVNSVNISVSYNFTK